MTLILCLLVAALYFLPSRHEAVFYPMGGMPFRIITYGRTDAAFENDVKESQKRVDELEDIFNAHRPKSEVSQINIKALLAPVVLSRDMQRVVTEAKRFWEITGGAFDVTVGPLINLWKKAGETKQIPSYGEIKKVLSSVGLGKLLIFPHPNPLPRGERGIGEGTISSPLEGEGQGEGIPAVH